MTRYVEDVLLLYLSLDIFNHPQFANRLVKSEYRKDADLVLLIKSQFLNFPTISSLVTDFIQVHTIISWYNGDPVKHEACFLMSQYSKEGFRSLL